MFILDRVLPCYRTTFESKLGLHEIIQGHDEADIFLTIGKIFVKTRNCVLLP